jgi:Transcriptional regulator, AbiEi antitoxin
VTKNPTAELLKLTRKLGLLRPRDLQAAGIPRAYLKQLGERGELLKTGRGLVAVAV